MLQEINLLPERYKRDVTPWFLVILTIVLLLSSVLIFLLYYAEVEKDRLEAVNEAADLQLAKIELEALAGTINTDRSPEQQLQEAVDQLDEYRVPTAEFTAELIELLPERGFFVRYFYQRDGLLEVTVSFDQMEEAAHYYHELYQNSFVEAVRMSEIGTVAINEPREEAGEDELQTSAETVIVKPRYEATYELALDLEQTKLGEGETP